MSQLGIPGALPSGVGAVLPVIISSGGKIVDSGGGTAQFLSFVDFNQQVTFEDFLKNNASVNEVTAAGTPLLGANCPASTLSAPYKWWKIKLSDNSLVFIPAWK
jgi:hypothetical protein